MRVTKREIGKERTEGNGEESSGEAGERYLPRAVRAPIEPARDSESYSIGPANPDPAKRVGHPVHCDGATRERRTASNRG